MTIFNSTLAVTDPIGLHARPASEIVKAVKLTGFSVKLGRDAKSLVSVNSPLQLMALKVKTGEVLQVSVEAEDEVAALQLIDSLQDLLRG